MSEHGKRQYIADGDLRTMPKGSCPDHPFAEYCVHGGVATGVVPMILQSGRTVLTTTPEAFAVCSVCRQPDPDGLHRHECE